MQEAAAGLSGNTAGQGWSPQVSELLTESRGSRTVRRKPPVDSGKEADLSRFSPHRRSDRRCAGAGPEAPSCFQVKEVALTARVWPGRTATHDRIDNLKSDKIDLEETDFLRRVVSSDIKAPVLRDTVGLVSWRAPLLLYSQTKRA